jgi:glycosyltransferase involved in cell wall biosynthesis
MRLLYLLNVSNPGKLAADSGFTVAELLLPALADRGAEVTLAAPARVTDERIWFERTPLPGTKYQARFGADIGALAAMVARARPDVVVVNQIEHVPAVRAALLDARIDAMVAGYCHYLPFAVGDHGGVRLDPSLGDGGLGRTVLLAFVAGLAACDRVLVHSAVASAWVGEVADQHGLDLSGRIRVVPPPRDERLVRDPDDAAAAPADGVLVGIYNHRLYRHYGTGKFTVLAERLTGQARMRLLVTDLLGQRGPARIALDPSPEQHRDQLAALPGVIIVSDRGERTRYRQLLARAHVGLAPLRPGCPWSMSVIDCQGMGLPVIAPRTGWFAEHIDPELLYDSADGAVELVRRLAGESEFRQLHAKRAHESTAGLTVARVAGAYWEAIG